MIQAHKVQREIPVQLERLDLKDQKVIKAIPDRKDLPAKSFPNMSELKQKLWQESSISIKATIALYSHF